MEILSYEELKSRCMAAMPEGIDTREGSLIDTAVGPVCAELASAYLTLQSYYDLLFPDTSAEGYLDRIAAQYGISRGEASPAEIEAAFEDQEGGDFTVPAGMRFSLGGVFYLVAESWTGGGRLRCETAGEAGNQLGELLPCDYLTGFGKAEAVEVLTPGEEREDDESLRARVLELLAYPAFGGNVSDYKEKVRSLPGVGGVRVTPVVSGGGTVGIEVRGSDFSPAGESLLEDVRELLIPGQQADGLGMAPIGHTVTVSAPATKTIDLYANILADGDLGEVKAAAEAAASRYLESLRAAWEDEDAVVRYSGMMAALSGAKGVVDVGNLLLNGGTSNISCDGVPVDGTFLIFPSAV